MLSDNLEKPQYIRDIWRGILLSCIQDFNGLNSSIEFVKTNPVFKIGKWARSNRGALPRY